jgi:predicted nucleic acid-binding protein
MQSLFLLDTNAVSGIMAEHPTIKAKLSTQTGKIVTSAIVQGEIRYGLERLPVGKRRAQLESKASTVIGSLVVEPIV